MVTKGFEPAGMGGEKLLVDCGAGLGGFGFEHVLEDALEEGDVSAYSHLEVKIGQLGAATEITRYKRASVAAVILRMAPPLPAASHPSKTATTLRRVLRHTLRQASLRSSMD